MSYLLDYNPGTQQWGYPRRGANLSGTCIIHTAECAMDLDGDDTSAEVCANFIANRSDYGSYHRLVDSDSIIDMVPFEYEAWQDSETNPWAVGISAAVQAGRWNTIPANRRDRIYRNMAAAAAEFVRHMARKGITVPLRRITGAQARARVPGFCAHGDSGISRSDPGVQFEWPLFFAYTQAALSGGLSAQGNLTPVSEEDDFMATPEQIQAFFDHQLTGPDGGKITLGQMILESRGGRSDIIRVTEGVAEEVLDTVVDGVAGDRITLRQFLAEYRAHIIQLAAGIAAEAAQGGASVEDVKKAVAEGLSAGIKVDATVRVGE